MFSRVLRITALLGGGLLAFGGGALGTHYAHPYIESKLNPERKQNEEKLQQSFSAVNQEVDHLGKELISSHKLDQKQKSEISKLNKNLGDLGLKLTKAEEEIQNRAGIIRQKDQEINEKERANQEQKSQITDLGEKLKAKDTEINETKDQKDELQKDLDYIKKRLSLRDEDILSKEGLKKRSLNIKVREIKKKSIDGDWTTFETVNYNDEKKNFKVKKPENFLNHEQKAMEVKTQGINYSIVKEFKSWDKSILIHRYDVDYGFITSEQDKIRNFILNDSNQKLKISDYFQNDYLEEAFKILVAIEQFENFPFKHDLSEKSIKSLEFCSDMKVGQDFLTTNSMTWAHFTATEETAKTYSVYTNRFVTMDDFINYWMKKTVEFTRTGTADLFDLLNPILLSENYRSN